VNIRLVGAAQAAVLLALALALAGCGGSTSPAGAVPVNRPPATSQPAPAPTTGPSGTLKLTGFYTYDGPFTGQFDCDHNSDGHFALEGQEPYLMDIVVEKMREGTFTVNPQDPTTGLERNDPGQPVIDVYRLEWQAGGAVEQPTLRQNGGTITFADGGETGTLIADYVDIADASHVVHAELHWQSCPHD
jgi:hypothetical protein